MVEMLTPGVYVTEVDASQIVPTTSSSVAVFGGDFQKGVVDQYRQITTVDELIEYYGKPTNDNYNDWYQAYNFLQYGNNLLVSRAVNINGMSIGTKCNYKATSHSTGYGSISYGTSAYGSGSNDEFVIVDSIQDLEKGDIIVFSDNSVNAIDESQTIKYFVIDVNYTVDSNNDKVWFVKLHKDLELPELALANGKSNIQSDIEDWYKDHEKIFKINIHHNGSCEALTNSDSGTHKTVEVTWKTSTTKYQEYEDGKLVTKKRLTPYNVTLNVPSHLDNSDYVEQSTVSYETISAKTANKLQETTRPDGAILFDTNTKVLNENDWDYKFENGSIAFSTPKSKLKFFSKTLGTTDAKYEISIALPRDFASNNKRIIGNHCTRYAQEGIAVDSFFEYAPKDGSAQVAVFIYDPVLKEMKETYLVSLDPDEIDSYNNSLFIEKVINRQSNCVYVKCDTSSAPTVTKTLSILDEFGNDTSRTEEVIVPNIESYSLVADVNGKYVGHTLKFSCASDSTIQNDDLLNAYEVFDNKELVDIDIVIANELDNGRSALNLAEYRKDCIAFMGIPYEFKGKILTVSKKAVEATNNIVNFRNDSEINYNSMWISLVANYKYQYDRYNDTYRWINLAGDVAGLRASTNENQAPWWASAGLNRGQIKNVTKLAYAPNQTQRGTLYTNGINAIVTFPGQGTVLWGQKTMLDKSSSFDRVNVRCLFLKFLNDNYFDMVA